MPRAFSTWAHDMFRLHSLRTRLQLWYALVMVVAIGGLSAYLYGQLRINMLARVDAPLLSAGDHFTRLLDDYPRHEVDPHVPEWEVGPPPPPPRRGEPGGPPGGPGSGRGGPPPGSRPRRPPLELPHSLDVQYEPGSAARPYFALWRSDGLLMASEPKNTTRKPPTAIPIPDFQFYTAADGTRQREVVMSGPFDSVVLVGRSIEGELAELQSMVWKIAGGAAGALLISTLGGWWLSNRILRPLDAIAQTASRISASNLDEQIPTATLDRELQPLAKVLNAMFARLDAAFARQTQFTADASHELRTPLTVMQTNLELALAMERTPAEHQRFERQALSAAQRMRQLIEGLLLLARADAGQMLELSERVDLRSLAEEALAVYAHRAQELDVQLRLEAEGEDSPLVSGKEILLRRVLENLLENALRYTPPGGTITVAIDLQPSEVLLRVQDTGTGIAPEQLPLVFERFYRADSARARESGGFGLGLAICQGIVQQHHGQITAASPAGLGTIMTIRLPRVRTTTIVRQPELPVA
jgi:two-component system OmpR family sensor kinase